MNDGTAMDAGTRMDGGTPCGNTATEATIRVVIAHHDGRGKALREMILAILTLTLLNHRRHGRARIASGERKLPNRRETPVRLFRGVVTDSEASQGKARHHEPNGHDGDRVRNSVGRRPVHCDSGHVRRLRRERSVREPQMHRVVRTGVPAASFLEIAERPQAGVTSQPSSGNRRLLTVGTWTSGPRRPVPLAEDVRPLGCPEWRLPASSA